MIELSNKNVRQIMTTLRAFEAQQLPTVAPAVANARRHARNLIKYLNNKLNQTNTNNNGTRS